MIGGGAHHLRQVLWIVRPVGVHLADQFVAFPQRNLEAFDIRPAQPTLPRAMDDDDAARVFGRKSVRDRTGPVWRLVVNDHHAGIGMRQDGPHQVGKVLPLVVRWRYD